MMKYKLNPAPFKTLLERLEAKCRDLAKKKKKWSAYRRSASRMAHLGSSCDLTFAAEYCIVSGVPSQYFNGGTLHDQIIEKLRKAVMGKSVTSKACELSLAEIKNKRRKAIKLSNMGWRQINMERAMVLIKLETPLEVGITMEGGIRRYERVLVTKPDKDNKGGEYYIRQFVDKEEAAFFLSIEGKPDVDVREGGVRGLPRVTELDDIALRVTKNNFMGQMGGKVGVFVMSIPHDWAHSNGFELREEPILVICTLDGDHKDGREMGRSFEVYKHGDTIAKQPFGSFEVQHFQDIDRVVNKPLRAAPNSWILDVEIVKGSSMLDLLKLLTEDEASRMTAVVKMEDGVGDRDRWCVVMAHRGPLQNSTRTGEDHLIRERHVLSPTRRLKYSGKLRIHNPLTADDGNLRALEGEAPRKQQPANQTSGNHTHPPVVAYDPRVLEALSNPYPGTLAVDNKPRPGPRSLLASPVARNLEGAVPRSPPKKGRTGAGRLGINEGGTTREMESTTNDQRK